ncbi:sensor histidine kinase [Leisingera aquaemixtae]|uniref:histidine kinase n=1 Tax=Leisingera aquaemixtae TaxID=1396826 RepID=A0A0N7M4F7_9RHOB|nr:HAMP domain-containing sensor histidine kinase [Leisingera aquaemixtae]CUH99506.1 Osmolarity sensor protein EnvZ [Leisingera aquaemixtae]
MALRLRTRGLILLALAFAAGLAAAWAWARSSASWQAHQTRAAIAGIALDGTLRRGAAPPEGVVVTQVDTAQAAFLASGDYLRLDGIPKPAFFTYVSLLDSGPDPLSGEVLALVIASPDLRYPVAELPPAGGQSAAEKLGAATRLLAAYCSEPVIFARAGYGPWQRVDGTAVWGCSAAPRDLRLPAVLLSLLALAVLATLVMDTSAHFDRFARALRDRRRLGGPDAYALQGPGELQEIVTAVNSYLETEREQLASRAAVLSGVSHDLGTPATRLRLRAALIQDAELRQKFETDLDAMTGMIESVLTYTRAEMSAETPRRLSLTSLVEAVAADYQDFGKPVELLRPAPQVAAGGRSVFTSAPGRSAMPADQPMLVVARPVSLQRAVSNLIDNALKYGRRAAIGLSANSDHAIITVEDEGSGMTAAEITEVIAPFRRGDNTRAIDGFGLGLTIVATVAEQHGGRLYFEDGRRGLRACLEICRN